MPDIGGSVYGVDFPPSAHDQDWTVIANLTSTSFVASQTGIPEVGVNFTAPTSGRVLVCLGVGARNNAANTDRSIVTYILYEDSSAGPVVTAASAYSGITSCGHGSSTAFHYGGSYMMEEGLTPGKNYYCQVVYRVTAGSGTVDIASRDITVVPLP